MTENIFNYTNSEAVCPFCGAPDNNGFMLDAVEFNCGTLMGTMRIELTYHQSEKCKSNVEKLVKE